MLYFQEAVDFNTGNNFLPVMKRYRLPSQKNDISIFLLSDSYEYDIELIKNMPHPKIDYKSIILPYRIIDKIGPKPFRYLTNQNEYNNKLIYLQNQKLTPKLIPIKFPYPKTIKENVYIPISEIIKLVTPNIRAMNVQYIQENIFNIFEKVMGYFNFSSQKVLIIDTKHFRIYKNMTMDTYKSDLINSLISAYILNPENKIRNLKWTIIFRAENADYKFDLSKFSKKDLTRMKAMLDKIGQADLTTPQNNEEIADSIDSFDDSSDEKSKMDDLLNALDDDISDDIINDDNPEVDEDIKNIQDKRKSVIDDIKTSINELGVKFGKTENDNENESNDKKLYDAKTLNVNAELIKRITPSSNVVDSYKRISQDLNISGDNPVENRIIDDASEKLSKIVTPSNTDSVMNTTTSPREQKIRMNVGQLKLNNVSFDTLTSVTDIPMPPALKPIKITTTNSGALKGTAFANVSKSYEENLMDRDIVSTFMNLSNLPDGFYVTNVEVTDISTCTSLMNNWKVSLKNKKTEKSHTINVRVPKVINGRFYNNGIWYNIGKQDFPIPILKINKRTVILTTNYNKITVDRYDTKSLVDINMLSKVIKMVTDDNGINKYIRNGSSVNTNSRFVSTIEYDEYSKRWYSFTNKDSDCEIIFNRQQCAKLYSFVSVQENEFCCGMINKVPVVLNTETGLTRDGKTLTETMLKTLPENLQDEYKKIKPGKLSMYSQITIGEKIPLGVAIAAWEGMASLLKKCNCKYQYVDKSFNDTKYFTIPFKDKSLAIENTTPNQLIFNGFYRINTKAYNSSDFEVPIMSSNSVYVDIFNQLFFKQYSQLTPFITYHDFFVDAITKDVCLHYNIPNDISGMLIYASNLLADNNFTSENHSSLYRIRSSEIIPSIIHYHLAVAISKYNNAAGSKSKGNVLNFNPNEVIMELMKVPNVETMSALNPMVELHARENITKKGFRGVNDDRAYSLDKRTYDESMIGKMAISSPNNGTVGITRQLVADPKIESVRGYTSTDGVEKDFNDLQLASFSELLTPGTVTRDDAIRTAIATSQTSHIISTEAAQPVLISNGIDEIVPSYLTDEFSVVAEDDGTVLEMKDGYMIIQYKNGKKRAINVDNKYSFNTGSGFYVDNKLKSNFEVKDNFKKGDILAYHEKFFSKDSSGIVRLNVGPLAKVAFAGAYSTYEDAGLITHKMSKRLATKLTMMQTIKLNATDDVDKIVQVGDEVEISDPLVVLGLGDTGDKAVDNFLKAFQTSKDETNLLDTAKRTFKSKHAGRVVDVRMYTTKSLDKLSPSLFAIFDNYFKKNIEKRKILDKHDKSKSVYKLDTLYSLPTEPLKGQTIKGINCDILIEVYIEHGDEASVGDKIVAYGASKQVLSEVVPDGLEPYAESDPSEEISVFVSPSCILKRMIPSLLITSSGNKVLINLKRKIKEIWESN